MRLKSGRSPRESSENLDRDEEMNVSGPAFMGKTSTTSNQAEKEGDDVLEQHAQFARKDLTLLEKHHEQQEEEKQQQQNDLSPSPTNGDEKPNEISRARRKKKRSHSGGV